MDSPSNPQRSPNDTPGSPGDPVLARRELYRRLSDLGQRIGYSCFALAVVMFVIAYFVQFPAWMVTVIVASMALGSVVLAPAIVFAYGVKAADADDKGEKFGY